MEKQIQTDKVVEAPIQHDHQIKVSNRKTVHLSGVKQIDSFNNESFLLHTTLGLLVIQGQDLTLANLDVDEGTMEIEGKIQQVNYMNDGAKKEEKSLLNRLFT